MSYVAKRVIAPKRIRIYSSGGIKNWKLSQIYSPKNLFARVLFLLSLAFGNKSRETYSLPDDIKEYLEKYFSSTNLNYVAMTSYFDSRWIVSATSRESRLAILVKYGETNDPGLLREEEFHRRYKDIEMSVPLIDSFTTGSHKILVFPFYPTSDSMRANQVELAIIATRLQVLGLKHNDLAPWNTVRKDKELLVIDWEDFEESIERSELKGGDSQGRYRRNLWVSLIASSIGNFLLTFVVARGGFVASDLGKFSSLFTVYVLLLGISRATKSESDIAASLTANITRESKRKKFLLILASVLTASALITFLLSSSRSLSLALAIVLLSGPLVLDYFRFEFLRLMDSRLVMLIDLLWTGVFVFLLLFSILEEFYLAPIQYLIVWEVSAILATVMVLAAKRPRFVFPLINREVSPSDNKIKRNEIKILALVDYVAMYGINLLSSIALFSKVSGNSAFVYRLTTLMLAVLPLLAQVTLFSSRNIWIGNALKEIQRDLPESQKVTWEKIGFTLAGGLLCLSTVFLPYEEVFTALKSVEKNEFQLLILFQFLSYLSIFVTTEFRHWLRYFGKLKTYTLGIVPYLIANILIFFISFLKSDLILWSALNALLNVVFIGAWTLLYRFAASAQKQQIKKSNHRGT